MDNNLAENTGKTKYLEIERNGSRMENKHITRTSRNKIKRLRSQPRWSRVNVLALKIQGSRVQIRLREIELFFQDVKILNTSPPGETLSWGSRVRELWLVKEPQDGNNRPLSKI